MIWYQESTSLPPRGCLASDCRTHSPFLLHCSPLTDSTTHRGSSALSGPPCPFHMLWHYNVSVVIFTCSSQSETCLTHHHLINQRTRELPSSFPTLLAPLGKSSSFLSVSLSSLNSLYLISITCLALHPPSSPMFLLVMFLC